MSRGHLGTAPQPAGGPPFDLRGDLGSWAGRESHFHRHFEARESVDYFGLLFIFFFLHEISVEVGYHNPP